MEERRIRKKCRWSKKTGTKMVLIMWVAMVRAVKSIKQ